MVVSGAPEKEDNHAEKVCDMALDMVDAITDLKDPSTGNRYFATFFPRFQLVIENMFCIRLKDLLGTYYSNQ